MKIFKFIEKEFGVCTLNIPAETKLEAIEELEKIGFKKEEFKFIKSIGLKGISAEHNKNLSVEVESDTLELTDSPFIKQSK